MMMSSTAFIIAPGGVVSDAHTSLSVSVFHEVSIALRDPCLEQKIAEELKEKKKERERRDLHAKYLDCL